MLRKNALPLGYLTLILILFAVTLLIVEDVVRSQTEVNPNRVPDISIDLSSKVFAVQTNFDGSQTMSLQSAFVVPGVAPVLEENNPPLIQVEILDELNQLIQRFGAWPPGPVEVFDPLPGAQLPASNVNMTSNYVFPFDTRARQMRIYDMEQGGVLLVEIDLLPPAFDYCAANPDDPDCDALPLPFEQVCFDTYATGPLQDRYIEGTNINGGAIYNTTADSNRHNDPNRVLNEPQNNDMPGQNPINFLSLGFGGEITLNFPRVIVPNPDGPDLQLFETSYGYRTYENNPEAALVYGSFDGVNWYPLINLETGDNRALLDANFELPPELRGITMIRIVDDSDATFSNWVDENGNPLPEMYIDGYDVDGVAGCRNEPLGIVEEDLLDPTVGDPTVDGFVLVNPDTNEDIRPLVEGDIISLAETPSITIRAEVSGQVRSVRLLLAGLNAMDNDAPYSVANDNNNPDDPDYQRWWDSKPGEYTITATAYTDMNAQGEASEPLSLTFTIVQSSVTATNAPEIEPVEAQSNIVGDTVTLSVVASDPEGTVLRYATDWNAATASLPAGLSIDPATGVISGQIAPSAARREPYVVIVTVIDADGLVASTRFTWTVREPDPPQAAPIVIDPEVTEPPQVVAPTVEADRQVEVRPPEVPVILTPEPEEEE